MDSSSGFLDPLSELRAPDEIAMCNCGNPDAVQIYPVTGGTLVGYVLPPRPLKSQPLDNKGAPVSTNF
jgi:hypothetical protein